MGIASADVTRPRCGEKDMAEDIREAALRCHREGRADPRRRSSLGSCSDAVGSGLQGSPYGCDRRRTVSRLV